MKTKVEVSVSPDRTDIRLTINGKDMDLGIGDNRKAAQGILYSAMQFLYLYGEKKTKEKSND